MSLVEHSRSAALALATVTLALVTIHVSRILYDRWAPGPPQRLRQAASVTQK